MTARTVGALVYCPAICCEDNQFGNIGQVQLDTCSMGLDNRRRFNTFIGRWRFHSYNHHFYLVHGRDQIIDFAQRFKGHDIRGLGCQVLERIGQFSWIEIDRLEHFVTAGLPDGQTITGCAVICGLIGGYVPAADLPFLEGSNRCDIFRGNHVAIRYRLHVGSGLQQWRRGLQQKDQLWSVFLS